MPNQVTVTVEGPDDILNSGAYGAGAIIRLQTSATETGTFANVSGTGSTPTIPVVTGVRSYVGRDPAGSVSSWYRVRYESADATRLSSWGDPFQAGDETAGLICSVYDVEQELGDSALTANQRENVIEKIRQVTVAIEGVTGRWFIPRPLSGTTTYRVGTARSRKIRVSKGIRSLTTLGLAYANQPPTGGTYTTLATSSWWLDPQELERDAGWPATSVVIAPGATSLVYATFGAELTGSFGWASVPADIQGVAVRAVVRRFIGKGGGGVSVAVGPEGTEFLLPDMSGADRATIDFYRVRAT